MRRWIGPILALLSLGGCIDKLLENTTLPQGSVTVSVVPSYVSIRQGGEGILSTTVNRFGEFQGPVSLAVVGAADVLPGGVTAEITGLTTVGRITTAVITLRIGESAPVGTHALRVRATGAGVDPATNPLTLTITPKPDFSLAASVPALTIARGGISQPVTVAITRTDYPGPVSLALVGAPGITAVFEVNPATGHTVMATVSVAGSVAPGTYPVDIHGTAPSMPARSTPLTIAVTADLLQLIMGPALVVPQGASATTEFILNQAPGIGGVTFSVEGLPAGVTAFFPPGAPSGRQTLQLSVSPLVAPGSHAAALRAVATGAPDATAAFQLLVTPASISITLVPATVSLYTGTSTSATLSIARTSYAGPVTVVVEGAPPGVSVSATPATVTGAFTTLQIVASSGATPGQTQVTVRAIPDGLAPSAIQVALLALTVQAAPSGGGNVILDWSACARPVWVAGQDGSGEWTRLLPTGGVYRFSVLSSRGGYAWARAGTGVIVRYLTQSELTQQPLLLCDQPTGTKSITGTAVHATTLLEPEWLYQLGGATATSNGQAPNFVLEGVREGLHDLTAFGQGANGFYRGVIRRDLNLPDGGSLDPIDLNGPESFLRAQATLQWSLAGLEAGGTLLSSMYYLTTAVCTANLLHNDGEMTGVPESHQRADDFHMLTIRWSTPTGVVIASEVFHLLANRTMGFAPNIPATLAVTKLAGGHLRLHVSITNLSPFYNDGLALRYMDNSSRSMMVSASRAYLGTQSPFLGMPDLSAVAGWPSEMAIPSNAPGTWSVTATGHNGVGPLCTEGRRLVTGIRRGNF